MTLGPCHLAGELRGGWSPVCAHLAVLTAGSIGGTLCSWPQLAGEVVTARIGAFLQARGQGELSLRAALKPSHPPGEQTQVSTPHREDRKAPSESHSGGGRRRRV